MVHFSKLGGSSTKVEAASDLTFRMRSLFLHTNNINWGHVTAGSKLKEKKKKTQKTALASSKVGGGTSGWTDTEAGTGRQEV